MTKKLYRSKKEHIIAGVAGGLGEYFSIDPVIVRVLFVLLTLIQGAGIILYIILFFVIPKKETKQTEIKEVIEENAKEVKEMAEKASKKYLKGTKNIIGVVAIVIGAFFILSHFISFSWFEWSVFWPIALIVVGFYVLLQKTKE